MIEETQPYLKIWASVILLAMKDVEDLEDLDAIPAGKMKDHERKKRLKIIGWGTKEYPTAAGGSPSAWLESDYCQQIKSMIGIRR